MTNSYGSGTSSRRIAALLAGILAGLAVVGLLRRRSAVRAAPVRPDADPRAEALRRKLAGAREASEPTVPEAEDVPEVDADEARRRVHDEARGAIDDMRRSGDSQ